MEINLLMKICNIPIIINHTDGEEKINLSVRLWIPNTAQYQGKIGLTRSINKQEQAIKLEGWGNSPK